MKVEKMNKKELDEYCESLSIDIKKKKKSDLIEAVYAYERAIIDKAIAEGNCLGLLEEKIRYPAKNNSVFSHSRTRFRFLATLQNFK